MLNGVAMNRLFRFRVLFLQVERLLPLDRLFDFILLRLVDLSCCSRVRLLRFRPLCHRGEAPLHVHSPMPVEVRVGWRDDDLALAALSGAHREDVVPRRDRAYRLVDRGELLQGPAHLLLHLELAPALLGELLVVAVAGDALHRRGGLPRLGGGDAMGSGDLVDELVQVRARAQQRDGGAGRVDEDQRMGASRGRRERRGGGIQPRRTVIFAAVAGMRARHHRRAVTVRK